MSDNRTPIEITPELHRRIEGERRKGARERLADLERRLNLISDLSLEAINADPVRLGSLLSEIHNMAHAPTEPHD